MATELEERQEQDAPAERHGDGVTHAFILEQMNRGFAEINARIDAGFDRVNARIDRLMIVLIVGMFGIIASIIGVAVASFLR